MTKYIEAEAAKKVKLDEWHEIVRVLTDLPYMDDIINGNEGEG